MLESSDSQGEVRLPVSFGAEVLQKGKQLRELVRRHWKWLRWASLVSLLIAGLLGLTLPRFLGTDSPPSMPMFLGEPTPFALPPR